MSYVKILFVERVSSQTQGSYKLYELNKTYL